MLPESLADWALFLDFDGTLVDIAPTPDAVVLEPSLHSALGDLAGQLDGALAIVSGRPIAELDHFLAPLRLAAAGVHGQEMRAADGSRKDLSPDLDFAALRQAVDSLTGRHPALLLEDKGYALALHTRAAPELAAECLAILAPLVEADPALALLKGHCVFEIKAAGVDKGLALRRFMQEPPFAGRKPLFVGDDTTDEDGIAAAQALGGLGVRIGAATSGATVKLESPGPFRQWLMDQAKPSP